MSQVSTCDSENDEWIVDDMDYVREAEQTVYDHSQISIENALVLNKQMRVYLNNLKCELEQMLLKCQEKYKQNEILMTELSKAKKEPKLYTTYYFCGYPFFKDRRGGAPPLSAEYLRRTEKGDELFPLDLEKRVWLPRDKVELIQGVKKQVIEFLRSLNRNKIRQASTKRCASELSARIQKESSELESMHLKDLLKKTEGTDFNINWQNISMDDLQDRHLPNECMAMWNGYFMPSLNRKQWTAEEDDKLLNAANENDNQDWDEIAKAVENRSAYQCFVHYHTKFNVKHVPKNVRWTPEEDKKLMDSIEKNRAGNVIRWSKIMEYFPDRIKAQLYNRYMFTLKPDINRSPFTVEEDCILMAAIKEYGLNYREFPTNLLPGRTRKQIRSRYNNVLKFVNVREHWTEQHDVKLMELVEKYGTTEWSKISDQLISHTRTSCRQRYTTIKKFLDKHPNKTVSDVPRRKRPFSTNVTTENWMEAIIDHKNFESINAVSEVKCDYVKTVKIPNKLKLARAPLYNTPYYDFLKYSFNFKYGDTVEGTASLFENVQIACQLLQAPKLPRQIDLCDPSFSSYVTMSEKCTKSKLEAELLKSLIQLGNNDFQFPVNFNTIVGLRGLSAMLELKSDRYQDKDTDVKKEVPEPNSFDGIEALDLFKARFNSMFKNTAVLAKMHGAVKSVSLKLRNKRPGNVPEATVTTTTDFHNNETLVRMTNDSSTHSKQHEYLENENKRPSAKRARVTVLASTTVGLEDAPIDVDPLRLLQASTSTAHSNYSCYKYRVEASDSVREINITPDFSESETDGMMSDNEFVIWTPTVTDDVTGSASTKENE